MSEQQQHQQQQQLGKRHAYRLECKTCGCNARSAVGGITNTKQFAKLIQEQHKSHRNHKYELKQSFHAAELAHIFREHTTRVTTTSTTLVDVHATNTLITAANFTAGKKYLIYATAHFDGTGTGNDSIMEMNHGGSGFADSNAACEPNTVGAANVGQMVYVWWTVWTAVASEDVKMQYATTGTNTAGVDQATIVAIKLSDDLVDGGTGGVTADWYYQEVTANTVVGAADSSTNNATITFTPATASQEWLVLSKNRLTETVISSPLGTRIVRSGEAASTTPFSQIEGEDAANDRYIQVLARVFTLGAASNTFTEKGFSTVATAYTRNTSAIFALNLDKLRSHADSYSDAALTNLALGTALGTGTPTQVATASITPAVAGDVWCLGFFTWFNNNTGAILRYRMQVDNVDQPATQTTDNAGLQTAWDITDNYPISVQSIENLTAAAHTIDIDAYTSTQTSNPAVRAKMVMAVSMELPAAGGGGVARTFVVNETATVQEATPITKADRKMLKAENLDLQEAAFRTVSVRSFLKSETLSLIEQSFLTKADRKMLQADLLSLSEQSFLTAAQRKMLKQEALNLVEQTFLSPAVRKFLQSENLTVVESQKFMANRIMQMQEALNLSEQFIALVTGIARTFQVDEPMSIQEQPFQTVANRLMQIAEDLTYSEAIILARAITMVIGEQMNMQEQFSNISHRSMIISELMQLAETTEFKAERKMLVEELVQLAEAVIMGANKFMIVNETATVDEFVNAVLFKADRKMLIDDGTLPITENLLTIIALPGIARTFQVEENLDMTENVAFRKDIKMAIQDGNLELLESLLVIGHRRMIINEEAMLTERLDTMREIKMIIQETADITEQTPILARQIVMLVNDAMNMGEQFLSVRGKTFVVNEALDIIETLITKLEENVGPPPGAYLPFFFFSPARKRFRVKTQTQRKQQQVQRVKPIEPEIPKLPKLVTREWTFAFNVAPQAPTPQEMADLLVFNAELDRLRLTRVNPREPLRATIRPHRVEREWVFGFNVRQLVEREWVFSFSVYQIVEKAVSFSFDVKAVDWEELAMLQKTKALLLADGELDNEDGES